MLVITMVAADTGRTPTLLLPLVLLGTIRLFELHGANRAPKIMFALLLANLVLPAAHVTHKSIEVISPAPIEWVRYQRWVQSVEFRNQ